MESVGYEASSRQREPRRRLLVHRQRHEALRWCVLLAIPTFALLVMAGWAVLGASSAPPPSALPRTNVELEATVKTVDTDGGTVLLESEMLGIFGATLYVTSDTKVLLAEGEHGDLADLEEGADVRAAYDLTAGRKMATRIVVIPKDAGAEGRSRK